MYDAIFLDMDGTLLNAEKTITETTRNILSTLKRMGIEIILISGRSNKSMEYVVHNRINITEPIVQYIISTDGTMIKDIVNHKIIYQNSLDNCTIKDMQMVAQSFDTAFYIFTECHMYRGNRICEEQTIVDNWYLNGEFYQIPDSLNELPLTDIDWCQEKVNRILFFSRDLDRLQAIYEKLQGEKNIAMKFEKNYHDYQLLLVSKPYSKALGVKLMCDYLNIPMQRTIAFGDADNDIEMLACVGRGIMMKNAICDLGVVEQTHFTNREDGVAFHLKQLLEKGVFSKKKG